MHFLPTALAALLLASSAVLAKPLPGQSLAEIERRWSAGETEVSSSSSSSSSTCQPNAPGCYVYAWFHSIAAFCRDSNSASNNNSNDASIHSGTTHRDATPAWPIQREAAPLYDGEAFAYATDERTMLRAQRRRRAESTPLLARMKSFVEKFYRQRGETGVIARDAQVVRAMEEDAAPVLKPRRGMRYSFTA